MPKFVSSYPEHQKREDTKLLHTPSTAVTVTGTDAAALYQEVPDCVAIMFFLDLTDIASDAGDKLDVFIQTSYMVGTVERWIDIVHFAQVLGNVATDIYQIAKVSANGAEAIFETVAGAALAAGAVRNILGRRYRTRWEITAGVGTHTFGFQTGLQPIG